MNLRQPGGAVALGLLVSTTLWAQGQRVDREQRTWFELQAFVPRLETQLQVDPAFSGGSGSLVEAEFDLGMPRNRAALGLGFGRRIGERWRFEADYLRLRRSGDAVLARSLQIGDTTYAAGDHVTTSTVFQFARIVGGVSFVQTDTVEFGAVFGGALPRLRLDLRDDTLGAFTTTWVAAGAVPLLGLFFSSKIAPGWQVSGRVEGGRLDGSSFVNVSANVVWRVSPHIGLGAGLRLLKGHSQIDDLDIFTLYNKRLDYQLGGPQLFANFAF